MQNLKRMIKTTMLRSDLLCTKAALRYNGQPDYQSICTAIISIVIFLCFSAIFIISFINTLQLQNISSSEHLSSSLQASQAISDVYFAVGVQYIQIEDFKKYFVVQVNQVKRNKINSTQINQTKTNVPLSLCNYSQWSDKNIDKMQEIFELNTMQYLYCPTRAMTIQGTAIQSVSQYLEITLSSCDQRIDPACQTPANISAFMNDYIDEYDYFQIQFHIIDTVLASTEQSYIKKIVDSDIFFSLSPTSGSIGIIKISDFTIQTDTNILPWQNISQDNGYFIQSTSATSIPATQEWLYAVIQKSQKKLSISRKFGKLDQMLSYVGGLFSLLFVVVQFFTASFNQYRYQLAVAQVMFNYDAKGFQIKEEDMNFWTFFRYSCYDWMDFFGCIPESWYKLRQIAQTRQEVGQQLDIRYLMQKITYLQNVAQLLLSDDQRIGLLVTGRKTLAQMRRIRKFSQFSPKRQDQILKKEDELIQQTIQDQKNIFFTNQIFANIKNNQVAPQKQESIMGSELQSQSSEIIHTQIMSALTNLGKAKNEQNNKKIYNQVPGHIKNNVSIDMAQLPSRMQLIKGIQLLTIQKGQFDK